MSAPWMLLAVYLCGYGITAVTVAADLHHRADTSPEPELWALRHEHRIAFHAGIAVRCTITALAWPYHATRAWWWRSLLGLQTHR